MRVDELQRNLRSARDDQLAADGVAGRHGVDRYVRRARTQRTSLAVVIVLVLVSAGVFLATRGSDEQRVISGPGDVPHYLPDPIPEGTAFYQPLPGPTTGETVSGAFVEQIAWTSDDSTTPSTSSDVIVLTTSTSATRTEGRPPVVARGDTTSTAVWTDGDGHSFRLSSSRVSADVFDAIVSSVTVDRDGRAQVVVPAGFREVARLAGGSVNGTRPALLTVGLVELAGPGYALEFLQAADQGRQTLTVMNVPKSAVWFVRNIENAATIDVRGRSGWEADGGRLIFWWEDDRTLIEVVAPDADLARNLAESVGEVGDATWDAFVASAQSLPTGDQTSSQTFSSSDTAIATAVTVP
jgi:hypothetical protein